MNIENVNEILESAREKLRISLENKIHPNLNLNEIRVLYESVKDFVMIERIDLSNKEQVKNFLDKERMKKKDTA